MPTDHLKRGDNGTEVDERAALFEAQAGFARRVLRRFRVPERDVPDVTQDVFVNVCRNLDGFEGRSSIRTWFYRICARAAMDYHRRASRRYEHLADPPEIASEATQIEDITKQRTAHDIRAALDELSDDKRAVFVLYELEEMTMAEVALILRCPLQTAFARLYAARRHVNQALARAGWAGGAALAVAAPTRTAWAAVPELHAIVSAWRATLPDVWAIAQLGAQCAASSHAVTFAVATAIALSLQIGAHATQQKPPVATEIAHIGAIHAVVVPKPFE